MANADVEITLRKAMYHDYRRPDPNPVVKDYEYRCSNSPDLPMEEREVPIAEIQGIEMPVKDGLAKHSLVSIPFNCRRLEHLRDEKKTGYSTFNIVMTETCPYMASEFSAVVYAFNKFLAPFLDGESDIYTYCDEVYFHRTENLMDERDCRSRDCPNFLKALKEINNMIDICPHKHVRVFLFSNGQNSSGRDEVHKYIRNMKPSKDKQIDVFILSIGNQFPLSYAIALRNKLHTGPTNIPLVITCGHYSIHIWEGIKDIRAEIYQCLKIYFSIPHNIVPNLDEKKDYAYPGDYVYFQADPSTLKYKLQIFTEPREIVNSEQTGWRRYRTRVIPGTGELRPDYPGHNRYDVRDDMMMMMMMHRGRYPGDEDDFDDEYFDFRSRSRKHKNIQINPILAKKGPSQTSKMMKLRDGNPVTVEFMLKNQLKQWTSVLYRMSKTDRKTPLECFDFMQQILKAQLNSESIKGQTDSKSTKTLVMEFNTLLKYCKNKIWKETIFVEEKKEVEVLQSTVTSKYDDKLLKLRGHGNKEWEKDMEEFIKQFELLKNQIQELPTPTPEDCCRIMLCSFLSDLQDPDIDDILYSSKSDFLTSMTFSGIPVYAPIKDSAQINPWTMYVKNICVSPYEIMCQKAMEEEICVKKKRNESGDKVIQLVDKNETTKFNIIVPIIPKEYAVLLKPLVRSNVFSVACTFCILKNAMIVDHTCHIASLACVWMKTIVDFPLARRPEYIKNRILNIEETAKLYLDRSAIATYIHCIWQDPKLAVCTEHSTTFRGSPVKCESLIKPAFLVQISRHNLPLVWRYKNKLHKVVQFVLAEFIGRCLKSYQSKTPFIDFFLSSAGTDKREEWLKLRAKDICESISMTPKEMVHKFYEMEALESHFKPIVDQLIEKYEQDVDWEEMMLLEKERLSRKPQNSSEEGDEGDQSDPTHQPVLTGARSKRRPIVTTAPNMDKIAQLRRYATVGSLTWHHLRAWAEELMQQFGVDQFVKGMDEARGGLTGAAGGPHEPSVAPESSQGAVEKQPVEPPNVRPIALVQHDLDYAFGTDMLTVYIVHALMHQSSVERYNVREKDYSDAKRVMKEKVQAEWKYLVNKLLKPAVMKHIKKTYEREFHHIHGGLAKPMTREGIIAAAQQRGIDVSADTFDQVYSYRDGVALCRNCCQVEDCPYFLVPDQLFNRHLEIDRTRPHYPHGLHTAVYQYLSESTNYTSWVICDSVINVKKKRTKRRLPMDQKPIVKYQVEVLKDQYLKIAKKEKPEKEE